MTVKGFKISDGDGHVLESDDELAQYFEGEYKGGQRVTGLGILPSLDGWPRGPMLRSEDANRKYLHTNAEVWSECLEMIGAACTPIPDPEAGAREVRRCATVRTGVVAMTLPTLTNTGKTYGDEFPDNPHIGDEAKQNIVYHNAHDLYHIEDRVH